MQGVVVTLTNGNGAEISMIDHDSQCDFRSIVVTGSNFKGNTAASSNDGAVLFYRCDERGEPVTHSQCVKQLGGALGIYSTAPGGVEQYQPGHQRHGQVIYRWFPVLQLDAVQVVTRERGSE